MTLVRAKRTLDRLGPIVAAELAGHIDCLVREYLEDLTSWDPGNAKSAKVQFALRDTSFESKPFH